VTADHGSEARRAAPASSERARLSASIAVSQSPASGLDCMPQLHQTVALGTVASVQPHVRQLKSTSSSVTTPLFYVLWRLVASPSALSVARGVGGPG